MLKLVPISRSIIKFHHESETIKQLILLIILLKLLESIKKENFRISVHVRVTICVNFNVASEFRRCVYILAFHPSERMFCSTTIQRGTSEKVSKPLT
jgi:hypothetical protein